MNKLIVCRHVSVFTHLFIIYGCVSESVTDVFVNLGF